MAISLNKTLVGGNRYSLSGAKNIIFSNEGCNLHIEETGTDEIRIRPYERGKVDWSKSPLTVLYDTKNYMKKFILTGSLVNTSGGETALQKKQYLHAMQQDGGLATFVNEDETFYVMILRVSTIEIAGEAGKYEFIIELIEGSESA